MLIVGKNANYAASGGVANTALTPNLLDNGAIGIYGLQEGGIRDTLIVSGSTATGKTADAEFVGKTIKICEGLGNGRFKTSEVMDLKGIGRIVPSAYAAPVAWKGYIGYSSVNTAGTITIDTLLPVKNHVTIEVREQFSNREQGPIQFYEIELAATGETQQTIANKIKVVVDLGYNGTIYFTTVVGNSGSNYGVALTSIDTIKNYAIKINGAIEDSTITLVGSDKGSGTYERLLRFELKSQAKHGNLYTSQRDYHEVAASLVVGETYDVYVVPAINTNVSGGHGGAGLAGNPSTQTSVNVIVAFAPDGDTANGGQIEFETIMKEITDQTWTSLVEDDTP
jgi:hypothetical protein